MSGGYGARLFDQHQALLRASAISPEVARERGYVTVDTKKRLADLGFAGYQQRVPGLLVPVYDETGTAALHQYRPDDPRVTRAGRVVKYETPNGARMAVDVPPRVRPRLGDPAVPLWITEGVRKADAAVTAGLCCLGLLGVWNWRGTNANGGATALAFWESAALRGRQVFVCFDSDVMVKKPVHDALGRLGGLLTRRGALVRYVYLPGGDHGKVGLDDYLAAGGELEQLARDAPDRPAAPVDVQEQLIAAPSAPDYDVGAALSGDAAELLDRVHAFLGRFVAYPSGHTHVAHTLWCAHTHLMGAWESTPRLAFLSPEPGSGKTRALEVTELLVPRPVEAVNVTAAYLFRKVVEKPTILFDEIDTVFGPRAKENEEIRGLLNAGHRRGAVAGRCVVKGKRIETEEIAAYCAVAMAGLGGLPDTLLSRAVVVRMRRRAPGEPVEPFRRRSAQAEGHHLRDALAGWAVAVGVTAATARPDMPDGIADRDADVWEPLLTCADLAGGAWPDRARVSAVTLVTDSKRDTPSLGIRLLADLRAVFDGHDAMSTEQLVEALTALDEAPWGDLKGKALTARGLASRLRPYEVRSKTVRIGGTTAKGYARDDLYDAWNRYLSMDLVGGFVEESVTSVTTDTPAPSQGEFDWPTEAPPDTHWADPLYDRE